MSKRFQFDMDLNLRGEAEFIFPRDSDQCEVVAKAFENDLALTKALSAMQRVAEEHGYELSVESPALLDLTRLT